MRNFRLAPMVWLSAVWLAFTLALVGWWWWRGLHTGVEPSAKVERMLLWEGLSLLTVLTAGGVALIFLTSQHASRHQRLKVFFSTFAHDLKTSISRLRLRSEILTGNENVTRSQVNGLLQDIQRLDMQLENALWLANMESNPLLLERFQLSSVLVPLRNEFVDLSLELNLDAEIQADQRAFILVLRNLLQNSLIHGQADKIEINVKNDVPGWIEICLADNGRGLSKALTDLGKSILGPRSAGGNGLGLYLSRSLVERMQGKLIFRNEPRFSSVLKLKGATL